ncbi:hypothetical protein H4684_003635 [Desulfomicrobium macestii]|uniref:Relaxase/mobilization nuclease family protein n=1 Tax=Desulfomicrobium macestii TaxID=90731 RepID=A0ABR9H898_9BACT|nr:hypothetical protein [Desulfomicrobium macestii]MBE1426951.1 hypothetical protein [Desulfomicrobium macestii]
MLIKFLKYGKGDAQRAKNYFLRNHDWNGELRKEVRVFYGNPDHVASVANALNSSYCYTSGVLAWSPEDDPTEEQIEQTMLLWRLLAFAGLDMQRVAHCEILHRDNRGGVHIHTLTAQVDLTTGKRLNIAPPGWAGDFYPLRDWLNIKHGWARPEDPTRARLLRPGWRAYLQADAEIRGLFLKPDMRDELHDYILGGIQVGEIQDRESMVLALEGRGIEVAHHGRRHLSIKNPDTGRNVRLVGAIYEKHWRSVDLLASPERGPERRDGEIDEGASRRAYARFEEACQSRAAFNKKRFRPTREQLERGIDLNRSADRFFGKHTSTAVARSLNDWAIGYYRRDWNGFFYNVSDTRLCKRLDKGKGSSCRGSDPLPEAIGPSKGFYRKSSAKYEGSTKTIRAVLRNRVKGRTEGAISVRSGQWESFFENTEVIYDRNRSDFHENVAEYVCGIGLEIERIGRLLFNLEKFYRSLRKEYFKLLKDTVEFEQNVSALKDASLSLNYEEGGINCLNRVDMEDSHDVSDDKCNKNISLRF